MNNIAQLFIMENLSMLAAFVAVQCVGAVFAVYGLIQFIKRNK